MEIVNILIPVFLTMGLGALSVLLKVFKQEDTTVFTRYDYYFAFPILMFLTLFHTDFTVVGSWQFLLTNILGLSATLVAIIVLGYLFKLPKKFIGIAAVAGTFGNVAYMGIPIMDLLYGKSAAGFTPIVVGITTAFCLSIGVLVLEIFDDQRKVHLGKILLGLAKNPLIISIVLGIIASLIKLPIPAFLESFLTLVKNSASPVALFSICMFIVGQKLVAQSGKIAFLILCNMVILPVMIFLIGKGFGLSGLAFNVSLMEASLPLAATTFVIAQKYKNHENIVASTVVVSTLLSIISLSILIVFIK